MASSLTSTETTTAATPPFDSHNSILPLGTPMPQLQRPETFEEKLYRKFKSEPLVPIGCLTTAYFLGSGIRSFYNRDPAKSQTMMRLRVASQFATLLIFIGYAGMNSFTMQLAPGMAVPSEQGFGVAGSTGGGKKGEEEGEGKRG